MTSVGQTPPRPARAVPTAHARLGPAEQSHSETLASHEFLLYRYAYNMRTLFSSSSVPQPAPKADSATSC